MGQIVGREDGRRAMGQTFGRKDWRRAMGWAVGQLVIRWYARRLLEFTSKRQLGLGAIAVHFHAWVNVVMLVGQ
jgi:hypothetical protein